HKHALFTFLSYNHGHFGPRMFGPLRQLMPSPVQSNWRIHVRDPKTGHAGVYFVTTSMSNPVFAVAARTLSEGVSMHVPAHAEVSRNSDGTVHLAIDPGSGTAPSARADLRPADSADIPPSWTSCFPTYHDFLQYCVPQDRTLTPLPWCGKICRHEIVLGIPLDACEPLTGIVDSPTASDLIGDAEPVCFRVAKLDFVLASTFND
ncbi:MAG: hypothetical protein ACRD3W_07535, partial [Terriglobales bacterium]